MLALVAAIAFFPQDGVRRAQGDYNAWIKEQSRAACVALIPGSPPYSSILWREPANIADEYRRMERRGDCRTPGIHEDNGPYRRCRFYEDALAALQKESSRDSVQTYEFFSRRYGASAGDLVVPDEVSPDGLLTRQTLMIPAYKAVVLAAKGRQRLLADLERAPAAQRKRLFPAGSACGARMNPELDLTDDPLLLGRRGAVIEAILAGASDFQRALDALPERVEHYQQSLDGEAALAAFPFDWAVFPRRARRQIEPEALTPDITARLREREAQLREGLLDLERLEYVSRRRLP